MIKINRNSNSELLNKLLEIDLSIGSKSFYESEENDLVVKIGHTKNGSFVLDSAYHGSLDKHVLKIRSLLLSLNKDMYSFRKRLIMSRINDCVNGTIVRHFMSTYNVDYTPDVNDKHVIITESEHVDEHSKLYSYIFNKYNRVNKDNLKFIFNLDRCKVFVLNFNLVPLIVTIFNNRLNIYITEADKLNSDDISVIVKYLSKQYKSLLINVNTIGFSIETDNTDYLTINKCMHLLT